MTTEGVEGYVQPQPQQNQQVIPQAVQQPQGQPIQRPIQQPQRIMVARRFGIAPMRCHCPRCNKMVVSYTREVSGLGTWAICCGLCVIGCWPCCLIPFCVPDCKDVEHHCPICRSLLGAKKLF